MPLCTLYLIALEEGTEVKDFLKILSSSSFPKPLLASRPLRWIIRPETFTTPLLDHRWSLLIVTPGKTEDLAKIIPSIVTNVYTITAGVPSSVLKRFEETNDRLLNPKENIPDLTGSLDSPLMKSSSQGLELNLDVLNWVKEYTAGDGGGAVSMLNFLAFKPGDAAKASYQEYGKRFGQSAGSKRGGNAKIVGSVISNKDDKEWDEIAIAHYPTAAHFADMLASEDYQEINHRWRLPALKDTCILATTEVRLFEENIKMPSPNKCHQSKL